MNRYQFIQIAILTVALVLGYQTVVNFSYFIDQFILRMSGVGYSNAQVVPSLLIYFLMTLAAFFLILKYIKSLALWLLQKTDIDTELKLNISPVTFLMGIIVFWALKTAIEAGADIISHLADVFFKNSTSSKYDFIPNSSLVSSIVKLIAGIIFLRYAKQIAYIFVQKTEPIDPHLIGDELEKTEKENPV